MVSERDVLALVARYPSPGEVKTRLASDLGVWPVFALYSAFLRDLDLRLAGGPWQLHWLYTPADRPFSEWLGPGRKASPQDGPTLNARLLNGFRRLLRPGGRVVIMSTDSPHLPLEWIERAFASLDAHEVVLGPCDDGGYYLVGMRAPHDVFSGVEMSTDRVLAQTLALIRERGLSVALLPGTFDVDEAAGVWALHRWLAERPSADLTYTRAALGRQRGRHWPLAFSPAGAFLAVSPGDVAEERSAYERVVPPAALQEPWRVRHMALVTAIARGITDSLRRDAGLPLSDLAAIAAAYHDVCRDHSLRRYRLRPWGPDYTGVPPVRHDGHEARLAWLLRSAGAPRLATIVRRHNVIHALQPWPRTIDEDVLLLADAMADGDRFVGVAERSALVTERYADAHPGLVRAFQAAYGEVERRLAVYRAFGLDMGRVEREVANA